MHCFQHLKIRLLPLNYIFEAIEEDGEEQLAEVEDEELLDKLAEIFESHFDELYESADEE